MNLKFNFAKNYFFQSFGVLFLIVISICSANAQTKLIDSVWRGVANYKLKSVDLKLTIIIQFLENNKIDGYTLIQTYGSKAVEKYNIYNERYETNLEYALLSTSEKREFGTYTLKRDTVFIKLSEVNINATFKDNYLDGDAILSFSNDKAEWIAEKFSDGKEQTKVNSQNQSKPLTLYERLPKKLEQFSRTELKKYSYIKDYEPPKSGSASQDIQNAFARSREFEQKLPIINGEVEGGFAIYSDEQNSQVWISFTKFKNINSANESPDIAQANQTYIAHKQRVKERNGIRFPNYSVQKENFTNKSGQIVGQLIKIQELTDNGKVKHERIIFSYNEYVYDLISYSFGDAEKAIKLLPLE